MKINKNLAYLNDKNLTEYYIREYFSHLHFVYEIDDQVQSNSQLRQAGVFKPTSIFWFLPIQQMKKGSSLP